MFIYIQFFKQHVSIVLEHDLALAINKKIVLACDVYFKPPIIIRSHELHVGNIKRAMGVTTLALGLCQGKGLQRCEPKVKPDSHISFSWECKRV